MNHYYENKDYTVYGVSVIDYDCVIGKGTTIRQFCSITRGAVLGEKCSVAPNTCIDGSVFGDRCKIMHGVIMGPGFKFGNDCFVGPGVVLCNDAWPKADTDGFRTDIFDGDHWAIIVEDGASIGANATILPGVRIGEGAMIAAGAVVSKNVPPQHIYMKSDDIKPIGMTKPIRMRIVT